MQVVVQLFNLKVYLTKIYLKGNTTLVKIVLLLVVPFELRSILLSLLSFRDIFSKFFI